jgi:hypothetical protein
MKTSAKKKQKVTKELQDLKAALKALEATSHNPIQWTPILKLLAPIIARWAIRAGLSYFARKSKKSIKPKLRDEVAEFTADLVTKSIK